jgi:GcrA cell cycle regulator
MVTTSTVAGKHYWGPSGHSVKNPKWTDELIEELKIHLLNGLSATQIAKKLGFSSRNAIVGKLYRLKLPDAQKPAIPHINGLKAYNAEARIKTKAQPKAQKPHRYRERLDDGPPLQPVQNVMLGSPADDLIIPCEERCTLLTLTQHTCRWPIEYPGKTGYFFCGAWSDMSNKQPYCPEHTMRARR